MAFYLHETHLTITDYNFHSSFHPWQGKVFVYVCLMHAEKSSWMKLFREALKSPLILGLPDLSLPVSIFNLLRLSVGCPVSFVGYSTSNMYNRFLT